MPELYTLIFYGDAIGTGVNGESLTGFILWGLASMSRYFEVRLARSNFT